MKAKSAIGLLLSCCIVNVGLLFLMSPNSNQHETCEKPNQFIHFMYIKKLPCARNSEIHVLATENIKINIT